jgi:3-oxoacyl-[acyl-carrier protein] reductase
MTPSPPLALVTGGEGHLARETVAALEARGLEVLAPGRAELDVADEDSVAEYFEKAVDLGRLELLVNNAGVRRDALLSKMGEADWDEVMGVNLRGAFLCAKAAMAGFLKRRAGHVLNIGSHSGVTGPAGQANYAAAKAGLVALTQTLAREGGRRGVRANCVLPGWMETKFTEAVPAKVRERALGQHALERFNTTEDAAKFLAFLHTEMGAVSGQVFQLDSRV